MKAVLILLVVLLTLVATFALQNPGILVVRFLTVSGSTSLLVVIVLSSGVGVLVGALAGLPGFFRRRKELAAASRRIRELETEVGNLKKKTGGPVPPASGAIP